MIDRIHTWLMEPVERLPRTRLQWILDTLWIAASMGITLALLGWWS